MHKGRDMRVANLALLTLALVGCPKQGDTRVAGSDDDQLTTYEARLEELRTRGARYGLGSACIGGGQGIAVVVEAL